jgi:serine O-acetyltransferase
MNPYAQAVILSASTLRMLPHIALYLMKKRQIDADLRKYSADGTGVGAFIKVCTRQRVFRNLFYYRMGEYRSVFIKWLLPPEPTLNIWCPQIGPGCHFEHNYATYLNAEKIGKNFYCLQLVTLGNDRNGKRPVIGDNVKIFTGATVFGDVTIGDNATIGAGAVVNCDVPSNCTVAGNPARIVKLNGENVDMPLERTEP